MIFEKVKELDDKKFFRTTGVLKENFMKLSAILTKDKLNNKKLGGKPSVLSSEDQLIY